MNFDIKHEYFIPAQEKYEITRNVGVIPPVLYNQVLDWTCAIACLRSITSGLVDLGTDEEIVTKYGIKPGPLYSRDIKKLGILDSSELDIVYGCDKSTDEVSLSYLWNLLNQGYRVMTDWMYSYDHWTVVLSYLVSEKDLCYHTITCYDPYCGETFNIRAGHFIVMWQSGEYSSGITRDFIAVRYKQNTN